MTVKTYYLPDEARFEPLRHEATRYLHPAGFLPGSHVKSGLQITIRAGEKAGETFALERKANGRRVELIVRAEGLRGAAHGFHHVLRLLGFGFSFFADAAPKSVDLQWPHASDTVKLRPDFSVRGLLPWHNFLNSPTVWNDSDYERHFLTVWRWGGNTALFHQYDFEPLAAMPDGDGKWTLGKPMETTLDAPWGGTKGIKTRDFAHGTGKCFQDACNGEWGAASRFEKDPIAAAQEVFARACRFGRSLGVDVVFGFELRGDPFHPGAKERVRRRIAHVLNAYPDLHALCLWQSECMSQYGWKAQAVARGVPELLRKHGRAFAYMKHVPGRMTDAVRIAEWFSFACQCARELRPSIKIGFSGWGGDQWMRWGDYWRGLHEILPSDAFLAQLDNIDPGVEDKVSLAAKGLADQRELWSIPWVESDGGPLGRSSQWHPQDDAGTMWKLARSARSLGYSGLLGIHWQTAGVELTAAALADASWNSRASVADFRLRYARTFYSRRKETAAKVAKLLEDLEKLGPGWTGTSQQTEFTPFSWEGGLPVVSGKLTPELKALHRHLRKLFLGFYEEPEQSISVLSSLLGLLHAFSMKRGDPSAVFKLAEHRKGFAALELSTPHARRLLATMDFVLAYEGIRRQLVPDGPLPQQKALLKETRDLGLAPDPRLIADYKKTLRKVDLAWKEVFAAQVRRLDSRGDLGNLANMNLKAYAAWRTFRDEVV